MMTPPKKSKVIFSLIALLCFAASLLFFSGPAARAQEPVYRGAFFSQQGLEALTYRDTAEREDVRAISRVTARGVLTGYGDGLFRPNQEVTRREAVVMLVRALKLEDEALAGNPAGAWYLPYLQVAAAKGILTTTEAASLAAPPQKDEKTAYGASPATRREAALWLSRALKLNPVYQDRTELSRFQDLNKLEPATAAYLEPLVRLGIVAGTAPDRFSPDQPVTRAQMAVFLDRAEEITAGLTGGRVVEGTLMLIEESQVNGKTSRRLVLGIPAAEPLELEITRQGTEDFPVFTEKKAQSAWELKQGDRLRLLLDNQAGRVVYGQLLSPAGKKVTGTVVAVEPESLVLRNSAGQRISLAVNASVKVSIGEQGAVLKDLLPNQQVTVEIEDDRVTAVSAAGPALPPRAYQEETRAVLAGVVQSFDGRNLKLILPAGESSLWEMDEQTALTRSGRQASPALILPGTQVRITVKGTDLERVEIEGEALAVTGIYKGTLEEVFGGGDRLLLGQAMTFAGGGWQPAGGLVSMETAADTTFYLDGTPLSPGELSLNVGQEAYLVTGRPLGREQVLKLLVKTGEELATGTANPDWDPAARALTVPNQLSMTVTDGSMIIRDGRLVSPVFWSPQGQLTILANGQRENYRAAVILEDSPFEARYLRGQLDEVVRDAVELEDQSEFSLFTWSKKDPRDMVADLSQEVVIWHWRDGFLDYRTFTEDRFEKRYAGDYYYAGLDGERVTALSLWPGDEALKTITSQGVVRLVTPDRLLVEQVQDYSEGYGRWLKNDADLSLIHTGAVGIDPQKLRPGSRVVLVHDHYRIYLLLQLN